MPAEDVGAAAEDFPKASPAGRWIPGSLQIGADGTAQFVPATPGGNGMLRPFCGADLLGQIPPGSGAMRAGTPILAQRIFLPEE